MTAWNALLGTALVGTQRAHAPVPEFDGALGAALARVPAAERERVLWSKLALVAHVRAAGRRAWIDPAPLPVPAKADESASASPGAGRVLERVLAADDSELAVDWLVRCARARRVVPPRALVRVLEHAGRPAFAGRVSPVLGARGTWLAAQNADWRHVLPVAHAVTVEMVWDTGTEKERRRLLEELRVSEPARARELLSASWTSEAPAARAALLAPFEIGLSADDEPLLERALDEKRKETRAAAAELLAQLPDSAFAARARERVTGLVARKKKLLGAKLEVELPAVCDAAAQRDGVDPKPPQGMGERAWWLAQFAGVLPPSHWTRALDVDADELVALAAKSEWADALLTALVRGSVLHRDAACARALLAALLPGGEGRPRVALDGLVNVLSAAEREAVFEKLRAAFLRADQRHVWIQLTCRAAEPWSESFSRSVVRVLAEPWDTRFVYALSGAPLVTCLDVRVLPALVSATQALAEGDPGRKPLDAVIRRLEIKREIAEEFER